MKSIQDILVPIDFSEESIAGLKAAVNIANQFDSRVHTTHFILPNPAISAKHPKEQLLGLRKTLRQKQISNVRQQSYDRLKKTMEEYIPQHRSGHACIIGSSLDAMFEEFTNESRIEPDLVVFGRSTNRNLLDHLFGGDTETIIRNTEVPILSVPVGSKIVLNKIAIVTDLSSNYPEKIRKFCKSFYEKGSSIHFIHAITTHLMTENEVLDRISAMASEFEIPDYSTQIHQSTRELEGINEAIAKVNPDLLLMKTYNKTELETLLVPSLAEQVVQAAEIPILVEKVEK